MRLTDPVEASLKPDDPPVKQNKPTQRRQKQRTELQPQGAMAGAFARLKKLS